MIQYIIPQAYQKTQSGQKSKQLQYILVKLVFFIFDVVDYNWVHGNYFRHTQENEDNTLF